MSIDSSVIGKFAQINKKCYSIAITTGSFGSVYYIYMSNTPNTIEEIQNAEGTVSEIIKNAEIKSQDIIMRSKKEADDKISKIKKELSDLSSKKIREQKNNLAGLYKKIIDASENEVNKIKKINKNKSVEFILENL